MIRSPLLGATPSTLRAAIQYFANTGTSLAFVTALRWPSGPRCVRCRSQRVTLLNTRRIWKCRACSRQFSVKTGTIFEDSPLGFDKWLPVIWCVANRCAVSSYELARLIGVTQKTAWLMLRRVRLAVRSGGLSTERTGPRYAPLQGPQHARPAPRATPLLPRGVGVLAESRMRGARTGLLPHCARDRWRIRSTGDFPRGHPRASPDFDGTRAFTVFQGLVSQVTAIPKADVFGAAAPATR